MTQTWPRPSATSFSSAKQESELGTDAANLPQRVYTVQVDTDTSEAERDRLRNS